MNQIKGMAAKAHKRETCKNSSSKNLSLDDCEAHVCTSLSEFTQLHKYYSKLQITERSSELFSVLIIKRVSLEHCGKYICIATNHVGKVNQTADLYINGKSP